MKRVIASAALAVAVMAPLAIADSVAMRDGRVVENARVLKVGIREVEYNVGKRKVLYVVRKAEVAKITYRDGGVDTFPEIRKGKRGGPGQRKGDGPGWRGRGEFKGPRGRDRDWAPPPGDGMGPPPSGGPRHGLRPRPIDGVPPPPPPDAPPSDGMAPPPAAPPAVPPPPPQGGPKGK
jgi:hypothetical protein